MSNEEPGYFIWNPLSLTLFLQKSFKHLHNLFAERNSYKYNNNAVQNVFYFLECI